ncbi:SCO2524 family protein [Actinocorallia longicatena]|uniref:Uncharacterized protein n=1 Tax=Actinocorallia longicatena TaxID=111803 RepID=A0ABP6QE94_9ACTN
MRADAALLRALETAGLNPGPEELADALWLAIQISAPGPAADPPAPPARNVARRLLSAGLARVRPVRPPDGHLALPAFREPPRPRPQRRPPRPSTESAAVRIPVGRALPGSLDLMRSLSSLRRLVNSPRDSTVDEQATVALIAEQKILVPVLRPAPERWLRLVLLIDDGASMALWNELAGELTRLLERTGAFRDVRVRYLGSEEERVGVRTARKGRLQDVRGLLDPAGRQAVLVLSDCVGPRWRGVAMADALALLGSRGPLAVLQPFPERMWERTAVKPVPVRLGAGLPGLPNHRLRRLGGAAEGGVAVPILEIAPLWLANWGRLVAGTAADGIEVMAVHATPGRPLGRAPETSAPDDPLERVRAFRAGASPEAFALAGHLAAVNLDLPVMRLIQRSTAPGSRPSHLGEIFISGLLRTAGTGPAAYDFVEGTREVLLRTIRRSGALSVIEEVSAFTAARQGGAGDVEAFAPAAGAQSRRLAPAFAAVPVAVLKELGLASRDPREPGPAAPRTGETPPERWWERPEPALIDILRSTVRASTRYGRWLPPTRMGSGEEARHLLIVLSIADMFRQDVYPPVVVEAFEPLGERTDVGVLLADLLVEHFERWLDTSGPVFPAGARLASSTPGEPPTPEQRALETVEDHAAALSLCLRTLAHLRRTPGTRSAVLARKSEHLERLAHDRLTAAMVSLLRSFVVRTYQADSEAGTHLLRQLDDGRSQRRTVAELNTALERVRAALEELAFGISFEPPGPGDLFETGWSWGVCENAPPVDMGDPAAPQPMGLAAPAPLLPATVTVMEALSELFHTEVTLLGLLTEEEQRLAMAFRLRWELVAQYWRTVGTLGTARWPVEEVPWRSADGRDSHHSSLFVMSLLIADQKISGAGAEGRRLHRVLKEIDDRDTREASGPETVRLDGAEAAGPGPLLKMPVPDTLPLLLKNALTLAGLGLDTEDGATDAYWERLGRRRHEDGPLRGLWSGGASEDTEPSWSCTLAVVEALILERARPSRRPVPTAGTLTGAARDLLNEAGLLLEDLLSEPGNTTTIATVAELRRTLSRAEEILENRPATAFGIVTGVLRRLDELAIERADSGRDRP